MFLAWLCGFAVVAAVSHTHSSHIVLVCQRLIVSASFVCDDGRASVDRAWRRFDSQLPPLQERPIECTRTDRAVERDLATLQVTVCERAELLVARRRVQLGKRPLIL